MIPKPLCANLSSDVNNTPLKKLQRRKTKVCIDIDITIEYDLKSYQVKVAIIKCTKVQ